MNGLLNIIAGMMFFLGTSQADPVVVSWNVEQATGQIVAGYDPVTGSGYAWRNNLSGRRDLGQSFLVLTNTMMDAFSLKAAGNIQNGASMAAFTVKVFESSNESSIGSVLLTQPGTYLSAAQNPVNPGWITFDIEDLSLTAGKYYTVVLSFDNAGVNLQEQVFSVGVPSQYSGGTVWTSADGITYSTVNLDLGFVVHSGGVGDPRILEVDQRGGADYESIAAAVQDLGPGDTLRLVPGSGPYREPLFVATSGTESAPIIIEGNNELVTGFSPLTGFYEENGVQVCDLPTAFPCVLTYQGERLRQDAATGQFTKYARLSADQLRLELLPGTDTNGWEVSTRYFVVRIENVSNHIYRNIKASGALNDGVNLHGTGSGLVFENIEGYHNLDEGFSAHDNIQCEIYNGSFHGNDNGIANIASSIMLAEDVSLYDNLGWGIWLNQCGGNLTRVRAWSNGISQVIFGTDAQVSLTDCTVKDPNWTERQWITYKESANVSDPSAYIVSSTATVTGEMMFDAPGDDYDPIALIQAMPRGPEGNIVIEPGVYTLPSWGLSLSGLQNVQVSAGGVTFLATNPQQNALSLGNCANLLVEGLTIDYDPLPFTQGTLTAIDPVSYTADFTVHDGYPDLSDSYLVNRFHLFDAAQHRWKPGSPDYYIKQTERLGPRQGRIHLQSSDPGFSCLEVGDRIALNIRSGVVLSLGAGCSSNTFRDVTIHSGPGAAIMGRLAEHAGTFENVRVVPGPPPAGATQERLLSTCADAFNVAYTRAGPVLDGCEFSYMGDDSINLHGVILPVLVWEDARTCLSVRPTTEKFDELLRAGDEVRFLTEPDYRLLDTAVIEDISSASASYSEWEATIKTIWPTFASSTSASFYRVRFDRDLYPGSNGLDGSDVFFEAFASTASGYVIRNSYFHDHRARGLRLMTGSGLVESNTFERIKGVAISIGPSFDYWKEAGWIEDVVISNNVISDVGQGMNMLWADSSTLGAISVFAEVEPDGQNTIYYPGNRNLTITGNTIDGCSLDGIHVVAGKDILIEGNTISRVNLVSAPDAGSERGLSSGQPITVQYSENVAVTNNVTGE